MDHAKELKESLARFAGRRADLRVLDADETERLTWDVASRFVEDPSCLWWWESLLGVSQSIEYHGDGLKLLSTLLAARSGELTLFVTDEQRPPWMALRGSRDALIELLGDHQSFEYFVVDDSLDWIIFDTHHDCLVIVGAP